MSTQEMIKEAIMLSPKEKSQIIDALILSLDQPDSRIEDMWNEEVEKRVNTANFFPHINGLFFPLSNKIKQDQRSLFSTGLSSGMNFL